MNLEQMERHIEGQRRRRAAAPFSMRRQKPNKAGYIEVRLVNHPILGTCRIYEHRLVMVEELGRPLRRDEEVHHRNEDRADNRRSNLIMKDGHGAHMRDHHPIDFTPEVRQKISDGVKAAWAKKR